MITNILVAVVLAVIIVTVWAWIGDWVGSATHQVDADFWKSQTLECPECGSIYKPLDQQNVVVAFGDIHLAISLQCNSCGETAAFASSDGVVECVSVENQQRRCKSCEEQFYGTQDTECPICSEVDSDLVLIDR